jgi:hypothetical protein
MLAMRVLLILAVMAFPVAARAADDACDNAQFLKDRAAFASGQISGDQPETVCGQVTRVLPSKHTRSGNHGYFFVSVGQGRPIEIVSDLDRMNAPAWPWVKAGDRVTARGRYYYDSAKSQGIDWTHHGTSRSWPQAGYVTVDGTRYE